MSANPKTGVLGNWFVMAHGQPAAFTDEEEEALDASYRLGGSEAVRVWLNAWGGPWEWASIDGVQIVRPGYFNPSDLQRRLVKV